MTGIDRRRFMQLAGGTAALSVLSPSIARAAQIPANRRTGSLRDVEHIVVLMQENRSFDHYLGTLRGVRGFGDPRPVTLPSGKPVWYQSDGKQDVLPFLPSAKNLGLQFLEDLDHGWDTGHQAFNGGKYDQWVPAKTATTMAHYTRDDIPFHFAMADAFTICDAYHCSLIGPTDPNRYYMWTGYVGNDGTGGGPVIANDELGYSWTTYPERLEKAGVSWKIYQDAGDGLDATGFWGWTTDAYIGNYGDNSLLYFDQYRNAAAGSPLYDKARTGTNAKAGQGFFDILKADVQAGDLPEISWIVAPEAFSEHPNWPANYGAWYVSQVLDTLTSNPDVWSKTALLICYDENDGFFDHSIPPYPPPSPAQGGSTVALTDELYSSGPDSSIAGPYGLGQRVPMFVVSPWSKGGWVCSEVFDHTSIIRLMERRFGVHEPNISPWRRAVCGDLTTAFDFARSGDKVPALPGTSGYIPPDKNRHPDYVPVLPANPELPKQERGLRLARPIPYDLAADGHVGSRGLTIDFASHGSVGATFHVTSTTFTNGPWTYTVEAGRHLSADWTLPTSEFEFAVHGPNGFTREFAGDGPEVAARHVGAAEQVRLVLTNKQKTAVTVTIKDGYRLERAVSFTLRPGAHVEHVASARRSHGWYDLSITSAGYLRRLTGHVETGRPSTSDPAIITV
jgi:phospholipase C